MIRAFELDGDDLVRIMRTVAVGNGCVDVVAAIERTIYPQRSAALVLLVATSTSLHTRGKGI